MISLHHILIFCVFKDPSYSPPPEERPGGFGWGAAAVNADQADEAGPAPNRHPHED